MTLDEVFRHFKLTTSRELAKMLGIHPNNITEWKRYGGIPGNHQLHLQELSKGKLTATYQDSTYKRIKDV